MQNSLAMLSMTVRRRLYFEIDGEKYYTNLFLVVLSLSGTSKSPPFKISKEIMIRALGNVFLSKPVSVQAIMKEMADRAYEIGYNNEGEAERKLVYNGKDFYKIRRGLCPIWWGEAGSFFGMLNQKYSEGKKDEINDLYGCPDSMDRIYSDGNRKLEFDAIYFGLNLATTPSVFEHYLQSFDAKTGWHPRFNVVNPTYEFKIQGHHFGGGINHDEAKNAFAREFEMLDSIMPIIPQEIKLTEEGYKLYDTWSVERQGFFLKERMEMMGAFWSKFQINVLKVAALIELANMPEYIKAWDCQNPNYIGSENKDIIINSSDIFRKNEVPSPQNENTLARKSDGYLYNSIYVNKEYKIEELTVGINSLKYAMYVYDEVYLKYHSLLYQGVREVNFPKYIQSFYNNVKNNKKVSKSDILTSIGGTSKDFEEVETTLTELGLISVWYNRAAKKPQTIYTYNASELAEYPFKIRVTWDGRLNDSVIVLKKVKKETPPASEDKSKDKPRKRNPKKVDDKIGENVKEMGKKLPSIEEVSKSMKIE